MKQTSIEHTIRNLISAADAQDTDKVSTILADHFRVILHQFPQKEMTSILDKPAYLNMMRQGKIGGETRAVQVEGIHVTGAIASATVTAESASSVFYIHYQLVEEGNDWKVITDMPKLLKKGANDGQ